MSPISTHILDTSLGHPAEGVSVKLFRLGGGSAAQIGQGVTDEEGRVDDLLADGSLAAGQYVIRFETEAYFAHHGRDAFYPEIEVRFNVTDTRAHYHVPLLLSPFGYSTYRGS